MTKLSKPSSLTGWAKKRAGNLDRMLAAAKKDDSALLVQSMVLIDALAHLLTTLGDDPGALYAASLARFLEDRARRVKQRTR